MKSNQLIKKTMPSLLLAVGFMSNIVYAQNQANQVISSNWKDGKNVVEFPSLDRSYFDEPAIINIEQLNLIDTEMNKEQVWRLIGRPHFKEGPFGTRVWDYAFRFKQADGNYKVCQYQVHFSKKSNLVENQYTNCMVEPLVKKGPKTITIEADALFAFAGSSISSVSSQGMEKVRQFSSDLNKAYSRIDSLLISGHTDYLGSDAANLQLSRERANTVRTLLVNLGVPSQVIQTEGKGEAVPVVSCAANLPRKSLIGCLAPNRRVTIQVMGEERLIN